jgi:cobalamin biosynthesis protein CobT
MDAYVNPLKRMMKFRDFIKKTTLTSQKRGKLDKGKLAMVNSTDRIYKKTFTDKSSNVSICLLVDESGSMTGPGIKAAKALACLFSEAFMGSKTVDLHVYGHTAQESYNSGPSCTIRKYPTKQSISDIRARCQNLDGAAIYGTAQEFLKVASGEQKIMIVLSDGNPYGSGYSGSSAVNHTRECVNAVEKLGITPMQVAIASHVNSDRMFKRWFKFTDMDKFIPEMGKMIKVLLKG